MRRCKALDNGVYAFPVPDSRASNAQLYAVQDLLRTIVGVIPEMRKLLRACEETIAEGRIQPSLGLLESIDVQLVNVGIYAGDGLDLSGEVARTLRGLDLQLRTLSLAVVAVDDRRAERRSRNEVA